MKRYVSFVCLLLSFIVVNSQVPNSFRYQAVARDNSGNLLSNQAVSFRISILSGSVSGTTVYSEVHSGINTNNFGLVGLEIGKGSPQISTFSSINWGDNSYYIKIEMDPAGGTAYQVLSTSQLLSVPYALHAQTVEEDAVDDADANPVNELQSLSINGSNLTLSNGGGTIELPSTGGEDNWGTQSVVSNSTLSGNGTAAAPLQLGQQSAAFGQVLKWNGSTWIPGDDLSGSNLWLQNASNIYFNAGNVGIGTSSPSTKLEIKSNSGPNIVINDANGSGDRPGIQFINNSQHFISGDDISDEYFGFYSIFNSARTYNARLNIYGKATSSWGTYLGFTHDGSKGIIDTDVGDIILSPGSGNIGIGTDSPQRMISIDGKTSTSEIQFTNSSTGRNASDGLTVGILPALKSAFLWNNEDGELYFGTNNARYMTIENNGRIGIGTNSADGALEIAANSSSFVPTLLLYENDADYARLMFKNTAASTKNWTVAGTLNSSDASSRLNLSYYNGSTSKDLVSVTGDGEVQQSRTGSANMLPIAYGSVSSNGSKMAGTNNFTSTYSVANECYLITISGENYFYDTHISFITINSFFVFSANCGSIDNKLVVYLKDKDGNLVQGNFSFITYKP